MGGGDQQNTQSAAKKVVLYVHVYAASGCAAARSIGLGIRCSWHQLCREEAEQRAISGPRTFQHSHTHERKYSKGSELPRQTVPRAPGAESPALRVTLAAESALVLYILLLLFYEF